MSQHHRRQKWTTHAPRLREQHEATLPRPCICGCGTIIQRGDTWHVGHRVDASRGGQPTFANTGPIVPRHNLQAGGRLGARVVNSRRQRTKDIRPW